jgi:hypothetical protein
MTLNVHVIECDMPPSDAPDMVGQHWIDTTSGRQWLSVGTATVADWILICGFSEVEIIVPATTTATLHLVPMADLCASDYQICLHNSVQDKWRSLKLLTSKKTSTSVESSVYAVLGEFLDVELNFGVVATDAVLEAVNNEAFPVTVKLRVSVI